MLAIAKSAAEALALLVALPLGMMLDRTNRRVAPLLGITVLGISKDGASSHAKFIAKYDLPFTLLSDVEPCAVAAAYGSYGLKKFMGKEYMGMMRHTFVVDAEGKIEKIYTKVKSETMADDILSDLGLA